MLLWFDWIDYHNPVMVICLFLMILVVFVLIFLANWYYDKRISEMMNRGLKAYQERKEVNVAHTIVSTS